MCRWLAYSGPPVPLGTLVSRPDHSLIDQSVHARRSGETTNGDGAGVGWYGVGQQPGRYLSTHPAWNDRNLAELAGHVVSGLFMAHVRAATGTPVQQTNCHPFAFKNWLFQHNGEVPEFHSIKRKMLFDVDARLFREILGSTDSELLFFTALSFGLGSDPLAAFERTVKYVETLMEEAHMEEPLTLAAAASDGSRLYAIRYSTDKTSPSLYHSKHIHSLKTIHRSYEALGDGAVVVLSEPLDELSAHWVEVPEGSFLTVDHGEAIIRPFRPA